MLGCCPEPPCDNLVPPLSFLNLCWVGLRLSVSRLKLPQEQSLPLLPGPWLGPLQCCRAQLLLIHSSHPSGGRKSWLCDSGHDAACLGPISPVMRKLRKQASLPMALRPFKLPLRGCSFQTFKMGVYFTSIVCGVSAHVCPIVCIWRSEGNFRESAFSFHCEIWGSNHVISFPCLFSLSRLVGPQLRLLIWNCLERDSLPCSVFPGSPFIVDRAA